MWKKLTWFLAIAAAILVLPIAACSSADEPSGSQSAAPTRDVQSTITALSRQPSFSIATPTPVPDGVASSVQEFSRMLGSVNRDWDLLRSDYDTWQAGLTSCDQASVGQALGRFSSMFSDVSQQARGLPRSNATRHLSDKVIAALEAEEQALRSFDGNDGESQGAGDAAPETASKAAASGSNSFATAGPGQDSDGPAMASLFDDVYQARSDSARALQEVSDAIADWEARSSDSGRLELEEFAAAFDSVNERWDAFHQEYDVFRGQASFSARGEVVRQLSDLITGFGEVVLATRALSEYSGAGHIAEIMAETAEAEDLALRVLRASLQNQGAPAGNMPEPEGPSISVSKTSPSPASAGDGLAGTSRAYEIFETQLVAANTSRRVALRALEELTSSIDDEQLEALAEFSEEYTPLLSAWGDFRVEFDTWRAGGSGCSVDEAVQELATLNARYGELRASVGNLPAASVLRPASELMVEAVGREASTMQKLRDAWRPFEPGVYVPYRQARTEADRMRRQVSAGIEDLLNRYGIDAS